MQPTSFTGGTVLPTVGSEAYKTAQAGGIPANYTPVGTFQGGPLVSSSAPVIAENKQLGNTITSLNKSTWTGSDGNTYTLGANGVEKTTGGAPQPPSVGAIPTANLAYLDDYAAKLALRRREEIKGINEGFGVAKTQLEEGQKKETGSTTVGIARTGGYLGGSASGTGVMLNLAQSHRNEVVSLEAKRQNAILEANKAYDDKDFAVARERVKEAKDIEQQIYNRNQDFWNNQLKLQTESRAQDTFLQKKYGDQLEALSITGGTPDARTTSEIDNFYGVPGFTKKYIEIKKADTQAKSQKAMFDSFKSKMELMQSIPKGLSVKFGDETIVGLGSVGDLNTFHVEDAAGNVTVVTQDKRSGTFTTQSLGKIGTPSGTTGGVNPTAISDMATALGKVSGSDGYVAPTDYKTALRTWLQAGFTLPTFENNFKIFINPSQKEKYDLSQYYNKSADDVLQMLQGV